MVHSGDAPLLLRLLLLSVCLASCAMKAQSPTLSDLSKRPAILGSLENGKYSNQVIGFEVQLDPICTFADEARAIARANQFPQRLSLRISCGDNTVMLSSFPLHADEEAVLRIQAEPSLQGALDALGFKKLGDWQKVTTDRTEVLVQKLTGHSDSGETLLGFYRAFYVGRRYVSILAIGPKKNESQLNQVGVALKIDSSRP
jgi:hypothetical protein